MNKAFKGMYARKLCQNPNGILAVCIMLPVVYEKVWEDI